MVASAGSFLAGCHHHDSDDGVNLESQVLQLRTGIDILEQRLNGFLQLPGGSPNSCGWSPCSPESRAVGRAKPHGLGGASVGSDAALEDVCHDLQLLCSDTRELGEHLQYWAENEEKSSRLADFDRKLQELLEERLTGQDLRSYELQAQLERRMIDWQETFDRHCSSLTDTHKRSLAELERTLQERMDQKLASLDLQSGDRIVQLGNTVREVREMLDRRCSAMVLDCEARLSDVDQALVERMNEKFKGQEQRDRCLQEMQEAVSQRCSKLEQECPALENVVTEVMNRLSETPCFSEMRDDLCTQTYAVEVQQQRLASFEPRFSKLEAQLVASTADAEQKLRDEVSRIESSVAQQLDRMAHEQDKEKALACKHSELHGRELRLELERRCDSVWQSMESRLAECAAPSPTEDFQSDVERRLMELHEQLEQLKPAQSAVSEQENFLLQPEPSLDVDRRFKDLECRFMELHERLEQLKPAECAEPEQEQCSQLDVERRCKELVEQRFSELVAAEDISSIRFNVEQRCTDLQKQFEQRFAESAAEDSSSIQFNMEQRCTDLQKQFEQRVAELAAEDRSSTRFNVEQRCADLQKQFEQRLAEHAESALEQSRSVQLDVERWCKDLQERLERRGPEAAAPEQTEAPEQTHSLQLELERTCEDLLKRFEQQLAQQTEKVESRNEAEAQQAPSKFDISLVERVASDAAAEVWKHAEQDVERLHTEVKAAFDAHVQEVDSQLSELKGSLCALATLHRSDAEMGAVKSRLEQLHMSVRELEAQSRSDQHAFQRASAPADGPWRVPEWNRSPNSAGENLRRQLQLGAPGAEFRCQLQQSKGWSLDERAAMLGASQSTASGDVGGMQAITAGVLEGVEPLTPSLPETSSEDQTVSHQRGPPSPESSLASPAPPVSLPDSPPAQVERLGIFERLARLRAQASALEALEAAN